MSEFKSINKGYFGPFDKNMRQGTRGRVFILELGSGAIGTKLFDSAFRNSAAQQLADNYGFFLANLFTTNYYELNGEFVYNNRYGEKHAVDADGLLRNGERALPRATDMVRSWVLEKYYVKRYPDSPIAKAFLHRGVAAGEEEMAYAAYFFNFYLSAYDSDLQYLPAFLLSKNSPIGNEIPSLEHARDLIASAPPESSGNGEQASLSRIRNLVHNYLSYDVVGEIDQYLRRYNSYGSELRQIRKIIVEYYSFDPMRVANQAAAIGQTGLRQAAVEIAHDKSNVANLLNFSKAVAQLRSDLQDEGKIPYGRKSGAILLIALSSQLLNTAVLSLKDVSSPQVFETILNTMYVEGFIIRKNWEFYGDKVRAAPDAAAAGKILNDTILPLAQATLRRALNPQLDQWISIDPTMENYLDSTIKSLSPNTLSLTMQKLK